MRKLPVPGVIIITLMFFVSIMVIAGEKAEETKKASSKSTCSIDIKEACVAVTKASASTGGTSDMCCGLTKEEYAELCGDDGKCEVRAISIKGMTCAGCESILTEELSKVPGVIKVAKVSYKEEMALVCVDGTKCKTEALTKAVAAKGYTAEIIPAVAKTTEQIDPKADKKKGCNPASCVPTACGTKKTSQ